MFCMMFNIVFIYNHKIEKGLILLQKKQIKMQSFPKCKHRKNQSIVIDQQIPNHLSSFIRTSHSPSYLEVQSHTHFNKDHRKVKGQLQQVESLQLEEIKRHYQNIQKVLNEENLNLKMQSKYLASQMRKSLKRQKIQREDVRNMNQLYEKTKNRLNLLIEQNTQIKEFIQSKIMLLLNSIKLTNLPDLIDQIKQIIQQLCQYFTINLQVQNIPQNTVVKTNHIQEEIEVDSRIQELNDKFESLMYEYKSTSRPEIRKQCIDIAKEIKNLKIDRKDSINHDNIDQKTVQQLSRNQSNDYLSMKSKHSKHSYQFDESKYYNFQSTQKQSFLKHPIIPNHNIIAPRNKHHSKARPSSFRQDSCERS